MSAKTTKLVLIVALVTILASFGWWVSKKRGDSKDTITRQVSAPKTTPASKSESIPLSVAGSNLVTAASTLATAQSGEGKNAALALLHEALKNGNTNEMALAICRLLDAKTDATTGRGFKIGGGGVLLDAPTLRTWLLDQLAMLDPAAAADYARVILNTSDSPDEWALALRNLARGDTSADARALLENKTIELLRNEAWQRDPSVGYLEAFDTAVHLGGTKLLPPLTELVSKKDNQAVAHAAFLTLDRLVINEPTQTLASLNEHPEWMTGREETRANYFARADVGDAMQRHLVETYLLDPARSPVELQAFAGIFPNANFMISHNLLTGNSTMGGATLQQRDQAALATVTAWLTDPKFEPLTQPLTQIRDRLKEFTRQAESR